MSIDSTGHRQVVFGVGRGIDRIGSVGGLVADEDGSSDERRKRAIAEITDENYTAAHETRRS